MRVWKVKVKYNIIVGNVLIFCKAGIINSHKLDVKTFYSNVELDNPS